MDDVPVRVFPLFDFEVEPQAQFLSFDPLARGVARLDDEHDRRRRRRIVGEIEAAADGQVESRSRERGRVFHWICAKKSSNRVV